MQPPSASRNKWHVFMLVAVGVFMSTLDSSIVNVALPAIMADLRAPLGSIEWVVLSYLLTISSLLLTFGRLSDIRGRRWVYAMGFALFTAGSFFCAISSHILWLVAARVFQGMGAAMLMACSMALVVDAFPANERGRALGMVGTVVASGLTSGPALGGLILKLFSWHMIFILNIPVGLISLVLTLRILNQKGAPSQARSEAFDYVGAGLLVICFGSLILGLNRGHAWGWDTWRPYALFMVTLISGWLLIRVETRHPHPVFDPSLARIRYFTFPVLAAMVLFMALFFLVFLMPFYLVHPSAIPYEKVGFIMVIPFIFLFFISPLSGTLSDRIGSRLLCTLGMTLLSVSLFFLAQLPAVASFPDMAWRLALAGIGTALFISPNSSAVMSAVPIHRRGIAAGTVAMARNLGMVIGVALAGLVFNTVYAHTSGGPLVHYRPELALAFMGAFKQAMLTGSAVALLGVGITFLRGPAQR